MRPIEQKKTSQKSDVLRGKNIHIIIYIFIYIFIYICCSVAKILWKLNLTVESNCLPPDKQRYWHKLHSMIAVLIYIYRNITPSKCHLRKPCFSQYEMCTKNVVCKSGQFSQTSSKEPEISNYTQLNPQVWAMPSFLSHIWGKSNKAEGKKFLYNKKM